MIIHVVRRGENIYSIAAQYGVPPERIITDNEIAVPEELAVGQTLVILFPENQVTVSLGDTIYSIAQTYGVTVNSILRDNPQLMGRTELVPGQVLSIGFTQEKYGTLDINGYAYPYIDRDLLRRTLPYLTYLTLFTYGFTPEGGLIGIDDGEPIALATEYGVAPVMLLSTYDGQRFSNELASALFASEQAQQRLIGEVLANMQAKGYRGLDVDFEYVKAQDAEGYVRFIESLRAVLEPAGYEVWVALAPKTSSMQPGLLYEGHRYGELAAAANAVLLMTYEWGYTYGPPMAVAPINKVRQVLNYAVTEIPSEKIFMGIPNYGYDWTLPHIPGQSRARSISNYAAPGIAYDNRAEIYFDETAQSPFFNYVAPDGTRHEVWFEDARSIREKLALIREYGFRGGSYWNIMRYFPQNWLVLNALYNIRRADE